MIENDEKKSLDRVAKFFNHMIEKVADEAEKEGLSGQEILGFFCQSVVSFCLAGGMELEHFKNICDQMMGGYQYRLQQSLEEKLKKLKEK